MIMEKKFISCEAEGMLALHKGDYPLWISLPRDISQCTLQIRG